MSASVNTATVLGNLGHDLELKYTDKKVPVITMSIATNNTWKDQDGQLQTRTDWHRIVVYGPLAQNCHKYLEKGQSVYVQGRMQTRRWEDGEGVKRQTTEIVANNVQFLGKPSEHPQFNDEDLPF